MKNRFLAMLLLLVLALSLSSCSFESISALLKKKGEVDDTGTVRIVMVKDESEPTVVTVRLNDVEGNAGLFSVLDAGRIPYVENDGFLKSVGDVAEDAANGVYVGLWTSVEVDADPSGWIENRTFDGITLYPSLVGGKDMTVKDGAVLYVGQIVYVW